jgi:uncharacterized Zn-finger protein
MVQYYYSDGKEQFGPFSFLELKDKNINAETLIWHQGLKQWTPAKLIKDLEDILTLKDMMVCPYCAEKIAASEKKCHHCGEWIDILGIATEKRMIECPICAEQIEEGLQICPFCKEPIAKEKKEFLPMLNKKSVKNCPYCSEEILETAEKCIHCNEWLVEVDETEHETEYENKYDFSFFRRVAKSLIIAGVGLGLFHFGSWHLVLGKKVSALQQFLQFLKTWQLKLEQDFILDYYTILIRINDSYWGFARDTYFFDSPVLQWIMLGLSIGALVWALEVLILGYD